MGRNVSAIIQPSIPPKCKDSGTFTIPCIIGNKEISQAMLDLGASINVMPKSIYQSLCIGELKSTGVVIQLANRSTTHLEGVLEDVLVRVNELIFPADFYVLDMEDDFHANQPTLILGRPFLKTAKTKIDMHSGTLSMEFGDSKVHFNMFEAMRYPPEEHSIFHIDIIDSLVDNVHEHLLDDFPEIIGFKNEFQCSDCDGIHQNCAVCAEIDVCLHDSNFENSVSISAVPVPVPTISASIFSKNSITGAEIKPSEATQKLAPSILEPPSLELKPLPENLKYAFLAPNEKLPVIIAKDLLPEQEEKLLNILKQNMKAIGWTLADIPGINPSTCMHRIQLEEGVKPVRQPQRRLYPLILDVVKKEVSKLLATRIIYPISDSKWVSPIQLVLKKSGITVVKNSKEELVNRTIASLMGFLAISRFILHQRIKKRPPLLVHSALLHTGGCPLVYGTPQGVVLGHVISSEGILVDTAKIDIIASLPYPICVQEVRSFLGHTGFYRRFIQDFSKIALSLSKLLQKEIDFQFDDDCRRAFDKLKQHLVFAPVLQPLNWEYPFELMCDASNLAVGAILSQRVGKVPHIIAYASRTLDSTQANYTTTEKELLTIIFALDKFRTYLLGTKVTVFSDHAALKFLLKKPDAKPILIRWMLLLQEFDIEIKDKSGAENLVADHLSQIPQTLEPLPSHQIEKLKSEAKYYVWDDPYLWRMCSDQVIRRCVHELEIPSILQFCHTLAYEGHFGPQRTARKVLDSGFYWPTLFRDAYTFCKSCAQCQKIGSISRRNEMPQQPLLFCLECPIISDQGSHFCNRNMEALLKKYGVTHKVSTPYHPQINGQAETGTHRKLQLQELEEIRMEAYENSHLYKEKTKFIHDKMLLRKEFSIGQKVLLYNSRLKLFSGKLCYRWLGPYIVTKIFPYGAVRILEPTTNKAFIVNGHRLKPFHEDIPLEIEEVRLLAATYT
ncbi:uncharacterized protein LOC113862282 [Abrus precatorius]|uniref:RNA-directed DNA polymerase n=1 Tax=Abrus precatorius TaxID=3816 RepID=A0A8B8L721_ABRPR|nr:uncharacterized protein LOC113862282 [Abrus precatorius]